MNPLSPGESALLLESLEVTAAADTAEPAAFLILFETRKERRANASVSMGMLTGWRRTPLLDDGDRALLDGSHSVREGNFILNSNPRLSTAKKLRSFLSTNADVTFTTNKLRASSAPHSTYTLLQGPKTRSNGPILRRRFATARCHSTSTIEASHLEGIGAVNELAREAAGRKLSSRPVDISRDGTQNIRHAETFSFAHADTFCSCHVQIIDAVIARWRHRIMRRLATGVSKPLQRRKYGTGVLHVLLATTTRRRHWKEAGRVQSLLQHQRLTATKTARKTVNVYSGLGCILSVTNASGVDEKSASKLIDSAPARTSSVVHSGVETITKVDTGLEHRFTPPSLLTASERRTGAHTAGHSKSDQRLLPRSVHVLDTSAVEARSAPPKCEGGHLEASDTGSQHPTA
ncbi:hypothetical protein HPB51_025475 [Rhipicephalus microplus]|uniref:Uncharacterized protein n=1 Tax=Rhipicephalus microplus TaxID=6941 RepID=A0A9J6DRA4_RHIMP|nr:hypothetical protein HPB51_025475 [Rhipicephalus microplus]